MGNLTIIDNLPTQPVADTLQEVDQFLKTQPDPDAVAQLVKDLYSFGTKIMNDDPVAAEKLFRKVTELDPNYANGYINWGFSLHKQGRNDEAVDQYKISLTKSPEPSLALDVLKWLGGKDVKRFQDVLDALQAQPDLVTPLDKEKLLGDMEFQLKHFSKAAEAYERAQQLAAADPFILKALGDVYCALLQEPKASQYYTQAITLATESVYTTEQAISALPQVASGQVQPDRNSLETTVTEARKTLARLHYEIGDTLLSLDADLDQIWAHWKEAVQIAPGAESTLSIADTLYNNGQANRDRLTKAVDTYTTYNQASPTPDSDAYVLLNLGLCHYYLYNYPAATETLTKAAQSAGDYQHYANYWLGVLYSGQRKFEEAEPYYQRAFRQKPDEYFIIEGLILCLTALGKKDEALTICQKTKARYSTDQERTAEISYLIGNIHLDFKELDKALLYYKEALQQDPRHVFARHNLAHILEKKGEYQKARNNWNKAKSNYLDLLIKSTPV
ncbi:hypothetical protein BN8_04677 [Fibrisoma limi BUZ 3]|uniref:TPR repeat-containing protein n=1 Tax=Fibrisoma limi BUZ 3 TaxID=1185876 RepID=I2GNE2_9BACT|nr:tetratricopeptide repeat protein [Fibrisoma limi]CCH55420.1 hypothetical protein BN8_04677 [Fibrisoma limi BUZ 3]